MIPLLDAIRNKNREKAIEWTHSEQWATIEQLISEATTSISRPLFDTNSRISSSVLVEGSGIAVGTDPIVNSPSDQTLWTCSHCTFLNAADFAMCEMCGLPRNT